MKNKEKYVDELISELIFGEACNMIQRHNLGCLQNCDTCEKNFMDWLEKEYTPEEYIEQNIDWTKVPINTPVYVRNNKSADWEKRTFVVYLPEKGYSRFYCYSGEAREQKDAQEIFNWEYCRLSEEVDPIPYLKEKI